MQNEHNKNTRAFGRDADVNFSNHLHKEDPLRISKKQGGFTLIELLVVITIIGILAAMALPNFIKMRAKAKEAEVKAGIHAIQVALERYAVDSGGVYPLALSGADYASNSFMRDSMYSYSGQYIYNLGTIGSSYFHSTINDWERMWEGASRPTQLRWQCDPLIQFGYMGQFPPNPFQKKSNGMWSGQQDYDPDNPNFVQGSYGYQFNVGAFGVGGRYGNLMWDVAWGMGSCPNIDFIGSDVDTNDEGDEVEQIDNDVEGNFYYHPLFGDNRSVAEHKYVGLGDSATLNGRTDLGCPRLYSHDANGYVLYGLGSAYNQGRDYFTAYDWDYNPDRARGGGGIYKGYFCMTYGGSWNARSCSNGYSASEWDPLVGNGNPLKNKTEWARPRDNGGTSGPDGIPDFFVIDVSSSVDITGSYSPDERNDIENGNEPNN
jgi:prepilin-type N-terminal cleavage/methylation domain-containing protein